MERGCTVEIVHCYAIVKIFEKYGKITFIDNMVHWQGPKKGLPRGYCFLEYEKKENALTAINALHGKTMKGKSLVVSFAHMTPEQDDAKKRGFSGRPNSLSILRGHKLKDSSTDAKILAIERKLKLLQKPTTDTTNNNNTNRYKPY
ncbi:hypothetical protein INT47_001398 [Mucor saturninus]|uniref:RRM domain-containing protein n=1 Tax=Mucor saturninus TaxID=64648 RepID=A0A8H7QIQ3_9FUNG|nr:hypothetical protein INT47_001398 [Mucor saturninus]